MRRLAIALALGGAGAAVLAPATAAAARPVEVKVSLYGIQRFAIHHVENEEAGACYDDRGDYTERTVGRFRTARSVRMRLDSGGLQPLTPRGWPFEGLIAEFAHSVDGTREVKEDSCTDWEPYPLTTEGKPCQGVTTPMAATIVGDGDGVVRFFGGIDGRADQIADCDWGDRSGDLYDAKGRLPLGRIRAREEVDLVFRGKTHREASNPDGSGSTATDTRTTVYVKLRPVG
jgi:hypothetical protein